MARIINFADGASSETTPTIGNIVASNLVRYPDDATYEATEQGAPTGGNIYYNETLDVIRYYDEADTEWKTVLDTEPEDGIFHIKGDIDGTKKIRFEVDGITTGTTRVVTIADEDGVMVLASATQTLTNKTIEAASNNIITAASGNLTSTELNDSLEELQNDIDTREVAANKGVANGYAGLDGSGTVPAAQLPSYVDDVEEYADFASLPVTGETGKIYVTLDDNKTWRWSGSVYVEIGSNDVTSVNGQTGAVSLSADDITDIDTTTNPPTLNDGLLWDGSAWVPGLSSSVNELNDLSDVNLGGSAIQQLVDTNTTGFDNSTHEGQTFTTIDALNVNSVKMNISSLASNSVGTIQLEIWGVDGSGFPDNTNVLATSPTQSVTGLTAIATTFDFTFSPTAPLAAATQYAIIINPVGMTSGVINVHRGTGDIYAGGVAYWASNPAGPWNSLGTDFYFDISGTAFSDGDTLVYDDASGEWIPGQGFTSVQTITEWTDFTPTGTWTTNTTYSGKRRRVGTDAEIKYRVSVAGAPTATTLRLDIPPDVNVDEAALEIAQGSSIVGRGHVLDNATARYDIQASYNSSLNQVDVWAVLASAAFTSGQNVNATIPMTWTNLDELEITIKVPIVGWTASNAVDDFNLSLQTVKSRAFKGIGTQTLTTGVYAKVLLDSSSYDTHAIFRAGTNDFLILESGFYSALGSVGVNGSSTGIVALDIYVNGIRNVYNSSKNDNTSATVLNVASTIYLNSGDIVDLRTFQNSGANQTISSTSTTTYLELISEPDFNLYGAVRDQKDLYQKKTMTTDDTPGQMDFNNLEAGKTYRVTLAVRVGVTASEDVNVIARNTDNSFLLETGFHQNDGTHLTWSSRSVIFIAASDGTLTFTFGASTGTLHTADGDTYAILEELNNHTSTTKWS